MRLRPASLRARLVLACIAVAAVVGSAGLVLFTVFLHQGVAASVDTVLESRSAGAVARFLSTPAATAPSPAPASQAGRGPVGESAGDVDSLTVVYRPDGSVASSQPSGHGARLLAGGDIAASRRHPLHLTVGSDQGEKLRVLAVPVIRSGRTWVVAVAASMGPASAAADRAVRDLEIGLPVLLGLVALGAWALAGAALRPVERMRADVERLSRAHDPARSGPGGVAPTVAPAGVPGGAGTVEGAARLSVPDTSDELARLGRTFNDLLERLQRSLIRQRDLVADTGHELRTPLTVLRTELELADSPGRSRQELAESVSHARREVERLSRLAEDVLFLARADSSAPLVSLRSVDLAPVLVAAGRAQRARAESLGVELGVSVTGDVRAVADDAAIRRALDNLVANSLQAVGEGGQVRLWARRGEATVDLGVTDTGPGFPPGYLDRAFERFSRPDAARRSDGGGAGLGLAIVAEIAAAHGGTVHAANLPGGGAEVAIEVPAAPATNGSRAREGTAGAGSG